MFDDINKVILIGRLGADSEIRYMPDGLAILSFNLAISLSKKDLNGSFFKKTEWVKVVLYGGSSETYREYLKKGNRVYIEGSFRTFKTKTKEYFEIVASSIRLLTSEYKNDNYNSDLNIDNK